MMAYKLMRLRKNGTLGSLFIDRKAIRPIGEWMDAIDVPTKGYARRYGWHCTLTPVAPHLSKKDRIWCEVEVEDYEFFERPKNQGGRWVLAKRMKINKILRKEEVEVFYE